MILLSERLFLAVVTAFAIVAVEASAQAPPLSVGQVIEGVVADGGVICPLLRTSEGLEIALQGVARDRFPTGTQLKLEGRLIRNSTCMQGARTLQVNRILNAEYAR